MQELSLFSFLIVGLLAGWIASRAMRRRQGLVMNLLVGVVGAYVGNVLLHTINASANGFAENLVSATIGAIVLLWLVSLIRRR